MQKQQPIYVNSEETTNTTINSMKRLYYATDKHWVGFINLIKQIFCLFIKKIEIDSIKQRITLFSSDKLKPTNN